MEDTLDLPIIEVAGIITVMLVSTFIEEVNPWITGGLGIFGISWLIYRFFLSQKASKIADAREQREKEKELREKEKELRERKREEEREQREKEKELRERKREEERELREKKEHENTLKIQNLQIKKLEKDVGKDSDKGDDEGEDTDPNQKPNNRNKKD